MKKIFTLLFFALGGIISIGYTQNSFLFYGARENIFSCQADPTYQPDIRLMFGMPVISGLQLGVSSSIKPTDLIVDNGTGKVIDINNFLGSIGNFNQIGLDNRINLLFVGFQPHKNAYLTFGIDHRANAYGNFSREFLNYLGNGNAAYINQQVNFTEERLYLNQNYSYHIGYNVRISDFVFGTRLRAIKGINHFELTRWKASLFTDENSVPAYATTASLDFEAVAGGGAAILLDSARAEDFNFRDAISSGAGYGFDLGIAYNFNENWRFSLSGQNIAAWITWPERYGQRIQLAGDGEIEFTGFEASLADDESDFETELENFEQELEETFELEKNFEEVRTQLPSMYLATATYSSVSKKHAATLLYALRQPNIQSIHHLSLVYHFSPAKWLQLDGSFSHSSVFGQDFGLGTTLRGGPIQFNLGVDGLLGLTNGDNLKKGSVRVGLAFIFGKSEWEENTKDKKDNPIPNKYY
ncbi:MAG: DUF5723 family protein [Saprospiraceae bacterium]